MLRRNVLLGALALVCSAWVEGPAEAAISVCSPIPRTSRLQYKFHPGHYVAIGGISYNKDSSGNATTIKNDPFPDTLNEITAPHRTHIVGIQKRYYWSDLQTGATTYNFDRLNQDIAAAKAVGKKLSIFIQWKFRNDKDKSPVPAYLSSMTSPTSYSLSAPGKSAVGWIAAMNNEVVAKEFIKFLTKLSAVVDKNNAVSSIVFVETAMGTNLPDLTTAERIAVQNAYYTNLLAIDKNASCIFKYTPVIQLTNFPAPRLDTMTNGYMDWGVGMGGPDVWLDDDTIAPAYSYYDSVEDKLPVGVIVADGNYHYFRHNGETPMHTEADDLPYSTPETIRRLALKATQDLKANYIFWRRNWGGDEYYEEFLHQVETLTESSSAFPQTDTACPNFFASICKALLTF